MEEQSSEPTTWSRKAVSFTALGTVMHVGPPVFVKLDSVPPLVVVLNEGEVFGSGLLSLEKTGKAGSVSGVVPSGTCRKLRPSNRVKLAWLQNPDGVLAALSMRRVV